MMTQVFFGGKRKCVSHSPGKMFGKGARLVRVYHQHSAPATLMCASELLTRLNQVQPIDFLLINTQPHHRYYCMKCSDFCDLINRHLNTQHSAGLFEFTVIKSSIEPGKPQVMDTMVNGLIEHMQKSVSELNSGSPVDDTIKLVCVHPTQKVHELFCSMISRHAIPLYQKQ
jgi:hypothetical protein